MPKQKKDRWIGARVDGDYEDRVEAYIDNSDLNMGDLIRNAVDEYMENHPVKIKEVKE